MMLYKNNKKWQVQAHVLLLPRFLASALLTCLSHAVPDCRSTTYETCLACALELAFCPCRPAWTYCSSSQHSDAFVSFGGLICCILLGFFYAAHVCLIRSSAGFNGGSTVRIYLGDCSQFNGNAQGYFLQGSSVVPSLSVIIAQKKAHSIELFAFLLTEEIRQFTQIWALSYAALMNVACKQLQSAARYVLLCLPMCRL